MKEKNKPLQIPVLLLVFNRFESVKEVFNAVKKQCPKSLFIAADGPRDSIPDELSMCNQLRDWILKNITWDCEVRTLFRNKNTGCGRAVFEAISWFFDQVEEGIILEDDCLPGSSFFTFCIANLEKYRSDPRISIISGNNFQPNQPVDTGSDYYFSVFPSTWGWATWKRVWEGYNFNIPQWDKDEVKELNNFLFKEKKYNQWWINKLHWMQNTKPEDMWDFQFYFHCMKRKQLAIIPKANLVSNIGFGESATHTTDRESYFANLPLHELLIPLHHPDKIERNYDADLFVQKMLFGEVEQISSLKKAKRWLKKNIWKP